jgi:hypothetical protein
MKTRMNTLEDRIDQSVNFLTKDTKGTPMKNWKNYIPMFPISRAEKLKSDLVKRFSAEYAGVAGRLVYQAVNEAYALAAMVGEPLLLLPALAEEKVQKAAAWSDRQSSLLHGNPLALAA